MSHVNKLGEVVPSFNKTSEGYLLYPITNNMFDLFLSDGFKNGVRMRKDRTGQLSLVKSWGNVPKSFVFTLEN
jgi:hypothetical protein